MVKAYTIFNTVVPSWKIFSVVFSELMKYFEELLSTKLVPSFIIVIDKEVEKLPQTVNNRVSNSSSRNPVVLGEP